MAIEIERRFLVTRDIGPLCHAGVPIIQGYLDGDPGTTVRVRIAGGSAASFTVKGPRSGSVREEHETAIPLAVAHRILSRLPDERVLRKTRFAVAHAGAMWDIDRFEGSLAGLVIAEIELQVPDQAIVLPDWVGREITEDRRYGNSRLTYGWLPEAA